MIKKTQEEFCQEVLSKFGDTVEVISEYTGEKEPIIIRCKNCGEEFSVLPTNYLTKWVRSCKKCGKGKYFSRLKELEEYECQLRERFGNDVVPVGEYAGYNTPILHHCNLCGSDFESSPKNMLRRKTPCDCIKVPVKNKKHTTEEFVERAKQVHGDRYDYSKVEYKNVSTKVCIICPEHGEFWQSYDSHINKGYKCPECSQQERRNSFNQFIVSSRRIYGDKYLYPKQPFLGKEHELRIICPEHGEFFKTPINFIHNKQGCPKCTEEEYRKLWNNQFLERAKQVHGDRYDYSKVEYRDNHTKVCIICPEHGEFWQTPNNHVSQHQGCPQCAKESSSFGESVIKRYLTEHNIKFIHDEPCLDWLIYDRKMKPDFWLPDYNLVIEFDGIQHFEPVEQFGGEKMLIETQKRDKKKEELCQEHGVEVLRIPYWELRNISKILDKKLK